MKSAVKVFTFMLLVSQASVRELNAQTSEMQADRAHRDMEIHWPAAYDPSVAPVFSHNELLIQQIATVPLLGSPMPLRGQAGS